MPFNYKSPGVYVEEVDKGARPIESASTSVLAMIGLVRDHIGVDVIGEDGKMTSVMKPTPHTPTLITNWTEFATTFGDLDQAVDGGFLHQSMYGYFLNGGTAAYVVGLPVNVGTRDGARATPQLPSGEGYLLSAGGQRSVRIATTAPMKKDDQISVEVQPPADGAPEGTFNLVVRRSGTDPKTIANLTTGKSSRTQRNVAEVLSKETDNLLTAEVLEEKAGLPAVGSKAMLVPASEQPKPAVSEDLKKKNGGVVSFFKGNAAERTGIEGLEAIEEVTLVTCPDIVAAHKWGAASEDDVKSVQLAIINHCEKMTDRFAILDCPPGLSVQDAKAWRQEKMNFDTKFAALYYPWIKSDNGLVPPSGYIAGVYARVDGERGVHKAPANEVVRGVIGLEKNVSRNEQDMLNPFGVNCIRTFPGRGIRIWGARTLSSDGQWRYINVRRLFSNVEESILQGTQWIVFEPNDQLLWRQIKRDVNAFLTVVWRSGALFGGTAEQAFYVKVDEETNPKELRDLGYCIVEVGMAPVKPAEFVVFRVSQKSDGAGSASE